jgi:hypothetical protein
LPWSWSNSSGIFTIILDTFIAQPREQHRTIPLLWQM